MISKFTRVVNELKLHGESDGEKEYRVKVVGLKALKRCSLMTRNIIFGIFYLAKVYLKVQYFDLE